MWPHSKDEYIPHWIARVQVLTPDSSFLTVQVLGGSADDSSDWILAILVGDQDCIPSSCFHPWPSLACSGHLGFEPVDES